MRCLTKPRRLNQIERRGWRMEVHMSRASEAASVTLAVMTVITLFVVGIPAVLCCGPTLIGALLTESETIEVVEHVTVQDDE